MRKTYLVTVDVVSLAAEYDDGGKEAIEASLTISPYLQNPEVKLAPPSLQPLSNIEVRKNNES